MNRNFNGNGNVEKVEGAGKKNMVTVSLPADRFADESVERSILGRMLAAQTVPEIISDVRPSDFFYEEHRLLFELIRDIYMDYGISWDETTLMDRIRKKGLEDRLSYEFVVGLYMEACPDAIYKTALGILKEKALYRRVAHEISEATRFLAEGSFKLDLFLNRIYRLTEEELDVRQESLLKITSDYIKELEERLKKGEELGVSIVSGWMNLTAMIVGFEKGEYVVIGGRPGMGKTSFMLNLASTLYKNGERVPVLIVEIEMSEAQLAQRAIARWGGKTMYEARDATWVKNEEEKSRVSESLLTEMGNLDRIYVSVVPSITIPRLSVEIAKAKAQHGVEVVCIDYLQLIDPGYPIRDMQTHVTMVSKALKRLAKEHDVVIIALAQLSREVEKRVDKRPQMADLRASGQIEQDADLIFFLYRPDYYKKNPSPEEKDVLELIVAKNRQGKHGAIKFRYDKEHQKIEPLESFIAGNIEEDEADTVEEGDDFNNEDYDLDF